jgi:hypothetical protein
MVIAPANTGRLKTNKKTVINTLQIYNLIFSNCNPNTREFKIVTIKLILPRIEDIPAICNEKINKSTLKF